MAPWRPGGSIFLLLRQREGDDGIAELPDSSLIATRIGADVRRVVVGSPAYLSSGRISVSKVHDFFDFAAPRLRMVFSNLAMGARTLP